MFGRRRPESQEPLRYPVSGSDEVRAVRRGHAILNPFGRNSHRVRTVGYEVLKAGPPGSEGLTVDELYEKRGTTYVEDIAAMLGEDVTELIDRDDGITLEQLEAEGRAGMAPRVESRIYYRNPTDGRMTPL
ncbi:hypothetical protein A3D14_02760 [Candidatus Saccharibacteria bacterium RIFCSPHIGHO2_02_FULL_47_12]|nr:MAG: hypothetical protein A3D14_02760 [Candidatus Saccharibacteria bacterium RIFCSPHIGHO2_02_FULL_47_12]